MGRTAISKIEEAARLDTMAGKLTKTDSESASMLREQAKKIRKRAIRQMGRRPKRATGVSTGTRTGANRHIDVG